MLAPKPDPAAESLITYPSEFAIKVMGEHVSGFVEAITAIAARFDPNYDPNNVQIRPSKGGRYLGVTVTVTATSRAQLDDLYRALSGHAMVKVVL